MSFPAEIVRTLAGDILMRPYTEADVAAQADYLFGSPRGFLEGIGFNTDELKDRDVWVRGRLERLAGECARGDKPGVLVAELGGRAVSLVVLDRRNPDGVPRLHFHIFDPQLRGKGLGGKIFMAAVGAFSREHAIGRFLIEPKATNAPMNALMKKLGFRHVKDYLLPAGPVTREWIASQYEILAGG